MVIGNGLLASYFKSYINNNDVLVFASGVSDSKESRAEQFDRERNLLTQTINSHQNKKFIYFSTCGMYDPDTANTPYTNHKLHMEELIQRVHSNYLVFRLPQVVGMQGNKNNIINYLYECISENKLITVWDKTIRYIIDVEDVFRIVDYIVTNSIFKNDIINVVSKPSRVIEIVHIMEDILSKSAVYEIIPKGQFYTIDGTKIASIIREIGIDFSDEYAKKVIHKYFKKIKLTK